MHPLNENNCSMPSITTSTGPRDRSKTLRIDIALVLSIVVLALIWVYVVPEWFSVFRGQSEADPRKPMKLAAFGSAIIAATTLVWSSPAFLKRFPTGSVLLTVGWRMMMTGGFAVASAATKWTEHKTFCFCLLGCYFSFFLLESAFSIARLLHLSHR